MKASSVHYDVEEEGEMDKILDQPTEYKELETL